jgi:hypothetical protein
VQAADYGELVQLAEIFVVLGVVGLGLLAEVPAMGDWVRWRWYLGLWASGCRRLFFHRHDPQEEDRKSSALLCLKLGEVYLIRP